jgi:serine phosphatase RsbU (regulator of sigma subunit)
MPQWVNNALEDDELKNSPWANGERDRMLSYIGCPLSASDGTVIGCLALMQREPREFSADQLVQLGLVALWIQEEMTRETESARASRVQRALLPSKPVLVEGFELAGASAPARAVGGDFFDWRDSPDGLILSVADIMGKGVASAIIAASVRAVLRASDDTLGVDAAVTAAARVLEDDMSASGSFATVFHCRLFALEARLEYVDAGHGLVLHVRADGSWERLAHTDLPLGTGLGAQWTLHSVYLDHGDSIVAFSDGVLDIFDGSLDSMKRVAHIVTESVSAQAVVDTVFRLAKKRNDIDDVAVVVLRRLPGD